MTLVNIKIFFFLLRLDYLFENRYTYIDAKEKQQEKYKSQYCLWY